MCAHVTQPDSHIHERPTDESTFSVNLLMKPTREWALKFPEALKMRVSIVKATIERQVSIITTATNIKRFTNVSIVDAWSVYTWWLISISSIQLVQDRSEWRIFLWAIYNLLKDSISWLVFVIRCFLQFPTRISVKISSVRSVWGGLGCPTFSV